MQCIGRSHKMHYLNCVFNSKLMSFEKKGICAKQLWYKRTLVIQNTYLSINITNKLSICLYYHLYHHLSATISGAIQICPSFSIVYTKKPFFFYYYYITPYTNTHTHIFLHYLARVCV